jgi:nucleotide-binding universal stress UspA family protein
METDRSLSIAPSSLSAILVASTGEPFDPAVIERAVQISGRHRPVVHVLSIARIFGTALGLQHPGLYPTRKEWRAQGDLVEDAVRAFKLRGFEAHGRVIGSRHAGKAITKAAIEMGCDAIVIGAVPMATWRRMLWQDEAAKVARKAPIPVHLVALD